ncbi:MAG TPA: polysaccharide deacetylase family protein [Terriglobales bacterium]|nr:polysaccharide deacetylase family protein [Terriglobales bacterium]
MQSLISLTFDDGLRSQLDYAVPVLDEHDLCGTFFLVANREPLLEDGYSHPDWHKTDWNDQDIRLLKSMILTGHEVGAHSVHHSRQFLEADPKLEAEESKRWIENRLETEVTSFCYPFCHFSRSIKKAVVDAGYRQARWGANGLYYPFQKPLDRFKVDARHVGKHGTENVDDWIRADSWHVLMFHGIGTLNDGWSPIAEVEFARQMKELARYRDSGVVEVVTFKEGAQRFRQQRRLWH